MKAGHLLQLLLLSAVWGVSFLQIRIAGDSFPPLWVALLRCSSGALLLWSVMILGRRSLPSRKLLPWLLLVALFNNAIPFTFFAWGERTIPSSTAAVVNATTPIWTLLISLAVQRGHATGRMIAGVLLSFAGVVLVVYGHEVGEETASARAGLVLGVTLVVMASLCYAIATVMAKAKLKGIDPIGLATTQLTLASLMLLPVALAGAYPVAVSVPSIAAIATLGLAGSGIAYLLYYNLLAHVSATHVVAVTYLLPIWGLFWGLLAHETIGWTAYLGVAVVVAGLLILNWKTQVQAASSTARA
ncbi:DMT family transporter [Acidicapsa acidisoli]|uniref:DMT family transporter n=1 Tax=Acidicapsa acidisoli TaxID=1615681 RepID=UPI0021E0E140|nr:DMT family transporter [Acidicapsa acidisoli]